MAAAKQQPDIQFKCYVGGLAWETDSQTLREAFKRCGGVRDAWVVFDRDTRKSRGFGFVTFATSGGMTKAIKEMDGQEINGRFITVNEASKLPKPKAPVYECFVGGLAFSTSEESLWDAFVKFGDLEVVKIIDDNEGYSKGFGFVTFTSEKARRDAIAEMDEYELDGRYISVKVSQPKGSIANGSNGGGRPPKVNGRPAKVVRYECYVGGLPSLCDDISLQKIFNKYGENLNARVMWDDNEEYCKGHGYLTFANEKDMKAAIEGKNGKQAFITGEDGKKIKFTLKVSESNSK